MTFDEFFQYEVEPVRSQYEASSPRVQAHFRAKVRDKWTMLKGSPTKLREYQNDRTRYNGDVNRQSVSS